MRLSDETETTDEATSHLAKLQKPQQAIGYSHSTKLPKDGTKWLVMMELLDYKGIA